MMTTDTHDKRTQIRVLARLGDATVSEMNEIAKAHAEVFPKAKIWFDGDLGALVSEGSAPSDGTQWDSDGEPSECKEVIAW